MKTIRQARYDNLRAKGFFRQEARVLSRVPKYVPYLRQIVKERYKILKDSQKKGISLTAYEKRIKEMYRAGGHLKYDILGRPRPDVWSFFRQFESRYMASHPEYQSPWIKKARRFSDYKKKVDKGREAGYYKRRR